MQTCEGLMKVYGSIATFTADNLGSHALGGFKEGGSALRPCRHCLITHDDLSNKVTFQYSVSVDVHVHVTHHS